MSDAEQHLVAAGAVLADAKPQVERLLALSSRGAQQSVDVIVMDRSDASRVTSTARRTASRRTSSCTSRRPTSRRSRPHWIR